jgi:FKBP-type peptidyl-prolyl cis-trans isomerase FklB
MSHVFRTLVLGAGALALLAGCAKKDAAVELKDQKSKMSYCVGQDIGRSFKQGKMDVDLNVMLAGLKHALRDTSLLDQKQVQEVMTAYQQEQMVKQQAEAKKAGDKNLAEGAAFLEKNKQQPGIITTASGLQYQILRPGMGKQPTKADQVVCHYRGILLDSTEFDNSYKRNEPVTFPLGNVIPGWQEGMQLMQEGAQFRFFVPAGLAYGERGAGQQIGPNATLIFDVELLNVQPQGMAGRAMQIPPPSAR